MKLLTKILALNSAVIFLFYFIFFFTFEVHSSEQQCPEFIEPIQNPILTFPSNITFVTGFSQNDVHEFKPSSNYSAKYEYENAQWISINTNESCPNRSPINLNILGAEVLTDQNEAQYKACLYKSSFTKTCDIAYKFDLISAKCKLINPDICSSTPETCSDGFPPNLLDYPDCDRPELQQCTDGSYIVKETGLCPTEPEPDPDPEPTPEPTPEPDPEPTPEPNELSATAIAKEVDKELKDNFDDVVSSVDKNTDKIDLTNTKLDTINTTLVESIAISNENLITTTDTITNAFQDSMNVFDTSFTALTESNNILNDSLNSQTEAIRGNLEATNQNIDNLNSGLNNLNQTLSQNNSTLTDIKNNTSAISDTNSSILDSISNTSTTSSFNKSDSSSYWDSPYDDGFSGVYNDKKNEFLNTGVFQFLQQFKFNTGGSPPNMEMCFNTGLVDLGCKSIPFDWSRILPFLKICILITAAFTCRKIIFGG